MIPKTIHYCWFGGNPLPPLAEKCIDSWKMYCPDYEIKKWDESNYDIAKNEYMHQAYKSKGWAFVSDYARLDIIYAHGGIYLDTDVELLKNLDQLLINKAFAGFESIDLVNFGLGYGAEKGFGLLKELRDTYDEISFINDDGSLNLTTCPVYQTDFLIEKGLIPNNKTQVVDDILILPTDYLSPKSYYTGKQKITSNTFSIHHFCASWLSDEWRKEYEKSLKYKKVLGNWVGGKLWNASHIYRTAGFRGVWKKMKGKAREF